MQAGEMRLCRELAEGTMTFICGECGGQFDVPVDRLACQTKDFHTCSTLQMPLPFPLTFGSECPAQRLRSAVQRYSAP